MPFWRCYFHLVWATKNREPIIDPENEARLYAYIIAKSAELGVYVYAINGWCDHIHMIVSIPPKLSVAEVVKHVKGASSHFMGESGISFAWQRGYGVLTLGERQRAVAEAYFLNQKSHHQQQEDNSWLERYSESDEGPADLGLTAGSFSSTLREGGSRYDPMGEAPF